MAAAEERMKQALVGMLLSLACGSLGAQTVFFDDFNNETPDLNAVPSGWTVTGGTVDIIGSGPNGVLFDGRPGNGYYIDLDGSTNNAGLLSSTALSFAAGTTYELSFDLSGTGAQPNSMIYGINFVSALAPDVLLPVTLSSSPNFTRFSLLFATPVATSGRVVFDHQGGDNNGLLLDDVRVAVAIPEPETWGLLLAGFGLLGFAARRKRNEGREGRHVRQ
jgi:hypothetical protein